MKTTNLGDKYNHRVTLRLTDDQYNFLIKISEILGVSPSDYLRMVVNSGMVSTRSNIDDISNGKLFEKGLVGTDEDVKTNSNNII